MPRSDDIMGIIFCIKPREVIPSFGNSHKNTANKSTTEIIIKIVFGCLKLLLPELIISSNLLVFLFTFFVFKNGHNIHIINKIKKAKKRIRRIIKRYFLFLVENYRKLNLLLLKNIFYFFPTISRKNP